MRTSGSIRPDKCVNPEALATCLLFVIILFLPLVLAGLRIGRDDAILKNGEYRLPAPRPAFPFTLADSLAFPWGWEEYWRDIFPFRGDLIRWHAGFRYGVLGANGANIILMEDGFVFSLEEINCYRGKSARSDAEIDQFLDLVRRKRNYFRKEGIAYYFLLAPSRITFLRPRLADYFTLPDHHATQARIMARLPDDLKDVFILPDDVLHRYQDQFPERPLFFRRDNHWTHWGRTVGAAALVQAVRRDFPSVAPLDPLAVPFVQAPEDQSFWAYLRLLGVGFDRVPPPPTLHIGREWPRQYAELAEQSGRAQYHLFYSSDSFMQILAEHSPEILSFSEARRLTTLSIKSPDSSRAVVEQRPDILVESVFVDALASRYYEGFMKNNAGWFPDAP